MSRRALGVERPKVKLGVEDWLSEVMVVVDDDERVDVFIGVNTDGRTKNKKKNSQKHLKSKEE